VRNTHTLQKRKEIANNKANATCEVAREARRDCGVSKPVPL
jgi:hypothetical protein